MSIETTRFIDRTEAILKIQEYMKLKCETMSNYELDELLHNLKYELDVDIFESYIIED